MSHQDHQFEETSNVGHLLAAVAVTIALPLLPAVLGWYIILAK
ncbi:hypothetical protein [Catenovulum sediminis]|uniref:Uncharacterized protein n=1 Tax=Catenovulum sediminis TaxID=1740262 RepID=A0ABV1RF75_9ALTE